MKKTFINILVGVLGVACLPLHAQSVKVGHTRIDYIVAQTAEAKEATNQLTVQQTQAQNELKRLQKELEDKYALYQKNGAQMTDVIRKDKETELQGLQTRIQEFSRTADASLQAKYKQLMSPILSKIQLAIDAVAKDNGYTHILNTGSSTDVLYAPEDNNITDLVLKKMGITPGQNPEKPNPNPATPAKPSQPKKN